MKSKSFDDYLKTRFSEEKIAEVEQRAEDIITSSRMAKRPTFEEFEEEILKDPETRAIYESLRPEFELMIETIKAHIKAKALRKERAKH